MSRQRFSMFKPTSAKCLLSALLLLGGGLSSACTSGSASGDNVAKPAAAPTNTKALQDRLGPDDGYAFAVMYGADIQGNLGDCGCPKHPQGGLAWRMGYVNGFKGLHADVPAVQVDAGHMFSHIIDAGTNKLFPFERTRNTWTLQGYEKAGFAAANISYYDFAMIAELFNKDEYEAKRKEFPFMDKLVSANIRPVDATTVRPKQYVVTEVNSKRAPKPIRVAFTGVTISSPIPPLPGVKKQFDVDEPVEALKKTLPEMRKNADMTVVMVYGYDSTWQDVAKLADVDVVIYANNLAPAPDVKKVGGASVVTAYTQTKELGDLRVFLTPEGKIKELKNRLSILDAEIPKDAAAEKIVAEAQAAYEKSQREAYAAPPAAPQAPLPPGATPQH
jgi:2',3'-cyclic-nucleotide 2'-phosphodiesterase (5'-nucleotidase family)